MIASMSELVKGGPTARPSTLMIFTVLGIGGIGLGLGNQPRTFFQLRIDNELTMRPHDSRTRSWQEISWRALCP